MEFVSRALFKIEELKERLAAVEAERDAARGAAAAAMEKLALDLRQDPWTTTLHDIDSFRNILRTRAAALRAGVDEQEGK